MALLDLIVIVLAGFISGTVVYYKYRPGLKPLLVVFAVFILTAFIPTDSIIKSYLRVFLLFFLIGSGLYHFTLGKVNKTEKQVKQTETHVNANR